MDSLVAYYNAEQRKRDAWAKATPIAGHDAAKWRHDAYWHVIGWDHYGDRSSSYGWEVDHIVALILGGSEDPSNLRALHWRNNAALGGALSGVSENAFGVSALSGLGGASTYLGGNALKNILGGKG